jgi:glycerophosphoryl diester phosphodiesterase
MSSAGRHARHAGSVRRMRSSLVLAIALAVVASTAAAGVVNIGHRGAAAYAPEHTLASYDLALDMGADYIEQDLQLTSDGVLVVLHDDTLDRTARGPAENCTGPVATKTLAQIQTCDVGSWFNEARPELAKPEYVGLRIPTLEEVFRRYRRRASYYIETKSPDDADRMEERLLELLRRHDLVRPARKWRVLIQSFSPASLQRMHALDPTLPLIQLLVTLGQSPDREVMLDGVASYAVGIGPLAATLDAAGLADAHARCLAVHPFTVDEPARIAQLVADGVDGLFTNAPDVVDGVLGPDAAKAKRAVRRALKSHKVCLKSAR